MVSYPAIEKFLIFRFKLLGRDQKIENKNPLNENNDKMPFKRFFDSKYRIYREMLKTGANNAKQAQITAHLSTPLFQIQ